MLLALLIGTTADNVFRTLLTDLIIFAFRRLVLTRIRGWIVRAANAVGGVLGGAVLLAHHVSPVRNVILRLGV
jgi:hypothetical protein